MMPASRPAIALDNPVSNKSRRGEIIFVAPAFNEEANIAELLRRTRETMTAYGLNYRVIVVDDGSSDETAAIVESLAGQLPITLIRHPRNLGVGHAFRNGFASAFSFAREEDVIVTREADNTSDLGLLPQMLQRLDDGADVALASCYAPGGAVVGASAWRRLLSHCANGILRLLFPLGGIHTYTSFYRAYRVRILRKAQERYGSALFTESGFICMAEILIKLASVGGRIAEVPFTMRADLRRGASKMKVMRTIIEHFRFYVRHARLWFRSR